MKWNGKNLELGDLVTLSGKSDFGKSFVNFSMLEMYAIQPIIPINEKINVKL